MKLPDGPPSRGTHSEPRLDRVDLSFVVLSLSDLVVSQSVHRRNLEQNCQSSVSQKDLVSFRVSARPLRINSDSIKADMTLRDTGMLVGEGSELARMIR